MDREEESALKMVKWLRMQIKSAKLASSKRATSVHEWTFWGKGAW